MKSFTITLIALIITVTSNAQSTSLVEEYSTLKDKAETYNEYKVIKEANLDAFWSNVQKEQADLSKSITGLNDRISELEGKVASVESARLKAEQAMESADYAATHINVIGIDFTKDAFKMVSGFTILGLAIGLGFVIFLFKQSYSDSKKTATLLNEVESEYQDYRQKSLDKYVKIKRDFQTAQNRLSELERTSSPRKVKMTV